MLAEKKNFSVIRMARLLGVSRSGFYAWMKRDPSKRAARKEELAVKITRFHAASGGVYGAPRILMDLREHGEIISRKTVARIMADLGLQGVFPKRFKVTTLVDNADTYPQDLALRAWDKGEVNRLWVGDITYLRTWEGWLYLAVVMDAHSRRIIGWAIDETMTADLVEDALKMAKTMRDDLPEKVVFHTDKGTQYASNQISSWTQNNGITRSMGATGVAWDNAMAESFFATLKTEYYYRHVWATKKHARESVGRWIEQVYNRRRRHSALGQIDPVTYEMQQLQHQPQDQQAA